MSEPASAPREASRPGTLLGIVTLIFGILACMAPLASGVAVSLFVAILLIAAGIAQAAFAFQTGSFGKGLLTFLFGGLTILCGIVVLAHPLLGLASLTLVLAVYFLVDGISAIATAFQLKPLSGWGWMLFGGIVSVILGVLIWSNWPLSGVWAVGILVGIRLIVAGWSMIVLGSIGRELASRSAPEASA